MANFEPEFRLYKTIPELSFSYTLGGMCLLEQFKIEEIVINAFAL